MPEEKYRTCSEIMIQIMADHSSERIQANRPWNKIFKVLSKQTIQQNTLQTQG